MPWIAKEQQTPARAFGALKVITNGRDGTLDLPNEAMMSVDRDRLGEHTDTHRYAVLRLTEQRDAPLLTLPMHKVVPGPDGAEPPSWVPRSLGRWAPEFPPYRKPRLSASCPFFCQGPYTFKLIRS